MLISTWRAVEQSGWPSFWCSTNTLNFFVLILTYIKNNVCVAVTEANVVHSLSAPKTWVHQRRDEWLIRKAIVLLFSPTFGSQSAGFQGRRKFSAITPPPHSLPTSLSSPPCGFCWTHFQIWKRTLSGGGQCTRLAHSTRRAGPRRWSPYKETRDTKFAVADFYTRHLVEGRETAEQRGSVWGWEAAAGVQAVGSEGRKMRDKNDTTSGEMNAQISLESEITVLPQYHRWRQFTLWQRQFCCGA